MRARGKKEGIRARGKKFVASVFPVRHVTVLGETILVREVITIGRRKEEMGIRSGINVLDEKRNYRGNVILAMETTTRRRKKNLRS